MKDDKDRHHLSKLVLLNWEELKDDDLVEVSHCIRSNGNETARYEPRCISFKDLCNAVRVNLMVNGAIPFQGDD